MQIHQIVLGFGDFDLNDLTTLNKLSESQLVELKSLVVEGTFRCGGGISESWDRDEKHGCGHMFNPYTDSGKQTLKERILPSYRSFSDVFAI